jgi:hypothetical protein
MEVEFRPERSSVTPSSFPDGRRRPSARDACAQPPNAAAVMVRRFALAAVLAFSLAACKENDTPAATFFTGQGDVRVIEAHIVPTGDSSAQTGGGTLRYVIARVEFTNDLGYDATPDITHFFLLDRNNNRYAGVDSGSSVFTGVSNSTQVLKQGDKREYTVGFRTNDPNVAGTIFYER